MSDGTVTQSWVSNMEPQCSPLPSATTSMSPSDQEVLPRYTPTPSDTFDYAHGLFQEGSPWHHEVLAPQYSLVTKIQQRPPNSRRRPRTCSGAASSQSKQAPISTCPRCRSGVDRDGSCISCPPPPTSSASWASTSASRRHSRSTSEEKSLAIRRMPTRVVYRRQLVSSFVDLYLSYDKIARYQHADLANLPGVDFSSPTLQAAADTICFIGLGTAHNDQRLIAEARVRYGCALHLLFQELSEQRPHKKRFRQTVTSITLLQLCELFDGLSYHKPGILNDGWKWHLEAVQRYMRECGPENLLQSDYDWQLFQNLRHYTFYADVQHGRPSMFAEPGWLAMTADQAERDPAIALYNLRTHLPGLMARAKALRRKNLQQGPTSAETLLEFERLQTDILWLRTSLGNWMERSGEMLTSPSSSSVRSTFSSTKSSDPHRPSSIHECEILFQASFQFTSVKMASLCTTAWMLCLATNGLHVNLLNNSPIPASTPASTSASTPTSAPNDATPSTLVLEALERDSYVCATNLARCIAWCTQASIAQFPVVGDFHLRFIKAYFQKNLPRYAREVQWCEAMSKEIWERTRNNKMLMDYPQICHKIAREQAWSLLNA